MEIQSTKGTFMSREVAVVSGVHTAIGTFGGSLKDIAPTDLTAVNGGCSQETPAFNVNRLCSSGLQATVSASPSEGLTIRPPRQLTTPEYQ